MKKCCKRLRLWKLYSLRSRQVDLLMQVASDEAWNDVVGFYREANDDSSLEMPFSILPRLYLWLEMVTKTGILFGLPCHQWTKIFTGRPLKERPTIIRSLNVSYHRQLILMNQMINNNFQAHSSVNRRNCLYKPYYLAIFIYLLPYCFRERWLMRTPGHFIIKNILIMFHGPVCRRMVYDLMWRLLD